MLMGLGQMKTATQSLTDDEVELIAVELEREVTIKHAGDEEAERGSRTFGVLVLVMTLVLAIGVFNVLPAVGSTLLVRGLGFDSLLLVDDNPADCDLVLASRMTDVAGPRIHWQPVDGLPLIAVDMPRYTGVKYLGKRAFDVIVGGRGTLAPWSPTRRS